MTTRELLRLLDEAQELLNQATDAENRKRLEFGNPTWRMSCADVPKQRRRGTAKPPSTWRKSEPSSPRRKQGPGTSGMAPPASA